MKGGHVSHVSQKGRGSLGVRKPDLFRWLKSGWHERIKLTTGCVAAVHESLSDKKYSVHNAQQASHARVLERRQILDETQWQYWYGMEQEQNGPSLAQNCRETGKARDERSKQVPNKGGVEQEAANGQTDAAKVWNKHGEFAVRQRALPYGRQRFARRLRVVFVGVLHNDNLRGTSKGNERVPAQRSKDQQDDCS